MTQLMQRYSPSVKQIKEAVNTINEYAFQDIPGETHHSQFSRPSHMRHSNRLSPPTTLPGLAPQGLPPPSGLSPTSNMPGLAPTSGLSPPGGAQMPRLKPHGYTREEMGQPTRYQDLEPPSYDPGVQQSRSQRPSVGQHQQPGMQHGQQQPGPQPGQPAEPMRPTRSKGPRNPY